MFFSSTRKEFYHQNALNQQQQQLSVQLNLKNKNRQSNTASSTQLHPAVLNQFNNPTSTTVRGTNYFGTGGSGGGTGSGNGPFGGSGSGPDDGVGPGRGTGSGKARVRLNNITEKQYNIDVDCVVALKLLLSSLNKSTI